MFDLNDLLLENDNVDESCDSEHTEITSPDDGSGVKGGKEKVTDEGFMYYECEIDESNIIDGDPFEFITEAMYQNVINANNIAIAVLADEYKYLKENGTELHSVSEAAEEQDAKKKNAIAKWFASVGDKLSKFLDTILSKMMTLQAKFLLLFKKARTAIEAGFNKKDLEAPKYAVVEVEMWAEKAIEEAKKTGKSAEFSLRNGTITKETKGPADFGKEVMVIQRYGEHIKRVKKLKKDAMKALKLKEITTEQVEIMDPREIHMLFKAFAGDFFIKLYLYGSMGAVFGINMYLSILLGIVDWFYSKKVDEFEISTDNIFKE